MKVETPFPMAFQMQPTRQEEEEEEELQVRHAGVGGGSGEPAPSVGMPACSVPGVMGRHRDTVLKNNGSKRGGEEGGTRKYQHSMTCTGLLPTEDVVMLGGGGDGSHELALSAGQGHRKAL